MAKNNEQMAISDFNMERLQTKDLADHISATIDVGGNIAIFGRRGSGKTQISKQEIAKSEYHEVYLNLSVLERVDMGGYPNIMSASKDKKFVDFLLPQFYQPMIEGKKNVVALLDEVDKADPSLWAPLLEFTQFRSINGHKLPNLRSVIMTGNLISEGGNRPSPPLLDRTEKYIVEANAQEWLEWAGKSGHIHPAITAYINDHPKDLFGAVDPEDRYADPSPRSWHMASDISYAGESRRWSPELINKKVCGCVGKDAGIKYSNYYEHYQQLLPMIDEIFRGQNIMNQYNKLEPTKKLIASMITCARTASKLDEVKKGGTLPPTIGYVGKFLQNVSHEYVLIAVRSQVQIERLIAHDLDEHPDWSEVIAKINQQANF